MDDDVEVAPIYRHDGKDSQPTRPHENHGLAIEHLPKWMESQCKQQSKSLVVPIPKDHWKSHPKSRGHRNTHKLLLQDLGLAPHTKTTKLRIDR